MTRYRVTAEVLGAPFPIQTAIGGRNPGDEFDDELPEAVVESGAVEVVDESAQEEPSEPGTEPEPPVEPEPEPEPAGESEAGDAGEQQSGGDEADRERDELGRFVAHDESEG